MIPSFAIYVAALKTSKIQEKLGNLWLLLVSNLLRNSQMLFCLTTQPLESDLKLYVTYNNYVNLLVGQTTRCHYLTLTTMQIITGTNWWAVICLLYFHPWFSFFYPWILKIIGIACDLWCVDDFAYRLVFTRLEDHLPH